MTEQLRLACVQPNSTGNLEETVDLHASLVRSAESDVVVFPELSLTGYWLTANLIDVSDPRLGALVDACADTGAVALVGAPVQGGPDTEHIAMLAVDGDRPRVVYHKVNVGRDEARFTPGHGPVVIEVCGWRLGLAICRDTGFEEHAAETAALGIDAYLAGVVDRPEDAAIQLGRGQRIARAHEVWVGVASHAGQAGNGFDETAGRSFILSPDGEIVDRAGPAVADMARATLRRS